MTRKGSVGNVFAVQIDWKKYLIRLGVVLVAIVIISFIPAVIENVIVNSIDLPGIQKDMEKSFRKRTGYTLRTSGARFNLFYGIVFTGVHIEDKQEGSQTKTLLKTENLILDFSLLRFLQGENPVTGIQIHGGVLNPEAVSTLQWLEFLDQIRATSMDYKALQIKRSETHGNEKPENGFESPNQISQANPPEQKEKSSTSEEFSRFEYKIEGVQIKMPAFIRKNKSKAISGAFLNLKALPARPGVFDYFFTIQISGEQDHQGIIEGSGKWSSSLKRRIDFTLKEIPIQTIYRFLEKPGLSPSVLPPSGLQITQGLIDGKGSLTLFERGVAANLEGSFHNLDITLPFDRSKLLTLSKEPGSFKYNAGYMNESSRPAFVQLNASGKNFSFQMDYQNPEIKDLLEISDDRPYHLAASGELRFNKDQTGVHSDVIPIQSGTVSFQYQSNEPDRRGHLPIHFSLKGKNIIFNQPLSFDHWELNIKPDGEGEFQATGKILEAPIQIKSRGSIQPLIQKNFQNQDELVVHRDWNNSITVQNLSYQSIADTVRSVTTFLHQDRMESGNNIEGMGAVWKNKFIETPFYTTMLQPLHSRTEISLTEMKDANNLPRNLNVDLQMSPARIEAKLKPADNLSLHYTAQIDSYLPRHNLRFSLDWKNRPISFPVLLKKRTKPERLAFDYTYWGEGFLSGDLIQRSNSYLSATVENVDLSNTDPGKILMYSLKLEPEDLIASQFAFRRQTDGLSVDYPMIFFASPSLSAKGRGAYDSLKGGKVIFFYSLDDSSKTQTNRNGSVQINLTKDHTWVPHDKND